ncbi:MAG: hypothetical protein E6I23_08555 [Chloroflexi bacterium]|nr:MAG: hypothetical protein E6I23_08555 [Chloroflexota bacterium]
MIARFFLGLGLCVLMLVSSFGTYMYLGGRQSKSALPAEKPTVAAPRPTAFRLPGTLYLAQSGAIYSLSIGRFHQLTPEGGWTQPSLYPDGSQLLAVRRLDFYSDVFVLGRFGQVLRQITNNAAPGRSNDTTAMHWSFYPRLSPDGGTLWMSYDEPKFGYDVPFSIWAMPIGGTIRQGRLWTNSHDYTGGDMQPIPLPSGGIMYTKYNSDPNDNLTGQLWLTTRATPGGNEGRPLTPQSDDCSEPSLSGIAYLAPTAATGPFQLWFLPKNAYNPPPPSPTPVPTPTPGGPYKGTLPSPTPAPPVTPPVIKPIQITMNAGFDATSPLAWAG